MVECHHYTLHLLGFMDKLWFQQIILFPFSEPNINPFPITSLVKNTSQPDQEHPISSSSSSSGSSQNNSSFSSQEPTEEDDDDISSFTLQKDLKYKSRRPKRLSLLDTKAARCRSSFQKLLCRKLMREHSAMRRSSSCKSLDEQLEYEELKGFMDLGFRFKKKELCPRMMSVLPGLQRLDDYNDLVENHQELMEDKKKYVITRPYLSEAWLIKSPNSPLLNLRMPHFSDPSDMKKHLKSWARTVATVVQVEY